jgi:hypothetical protein
MLVDRLCKKLPVAIDSAKEAKEAFQVITDTADPLKVSEWTQQAEEAKVNRNVDPEAMDIYDMKTTPGWSMIIG